MTEQSNLEWLKEILNDVACNPNDVDLARIAVMIDDKYNPKQSVWDGTQDNTPAGYHQRNILNPLHIWRGK